MKKIAIYLFCNLLCLVSYSQITKEYINTIDSALGHENLPISNGILHLNTFRVYENNNIYFDNESITKGEVIYDSQPYFDINLKYDVFNDQLVYFQNTSNKGGIIINTNLVSYFKIYDKKFMPIEALTTKGYEGFYEVLGENSSSNDYFLCKHTKGKKDIYQGTSIIYKFIDYEKYYLLTNKELQKLNKGNLTKSFPNSKREIKEFYKNKKGLYETNKSEFYNQLFKIIQ